MHMAVIIIFGMRLSLIGIPLRILLILVLLILLTLDGILLDYFILAGFGIADPAPTPLDLYTLLPAQRKEIQSMPLGK